MRANCCGTDADVPRGAVTSQPSDSDIYRGVMILVVARLLGVASLGVIRLSNTLSLHYHEVLF